MDWPIKCNQQLVCDEIENIQQSFMYTKKYRPRTMGFIYGEKIDCQ